MIPDACEESMNMCGARVQPGSIQGPGPRTTSVSEPATGDSSLAGTAPDFDISEHHKVVLRDRIPSHS